jgi:hypothetical protein
MIKYTYKETPKPPVKGKKSVKKTTKRKLKEAPLSLKQES